MAICAAGFLQVGSPLRFREGERLRTGDSDHSEARSTPRPTLSTAGRPREATDVTGEATST